jgi:hypothetical protein
MIRERDTQIIIEQKKAEDLQKDRKFLFEKQQAQSTELLALQDEYANYKVSPTPTPPMLMVVGSGSHTSNTTKGECIDERSCH